MPVHCTMKQERREFHAGFIYLFIGLLEHQIPFQSVKRRLFDEQNIGLYFVTVC
jgi:hypothetical protein